MTRHVLLIEDEPNIVEAVGFILSRDGWRISSHANGETAMEAVRRASPDAIVLDVMLPGRSGYDVLEALRADVRTRAIPVLMLTARGQARDRQLAQQLGATRFMTKPFSNDALRAALRELLKAPGSCERDGGAA